MERVFATPCDITIGALALIEDGTSRNFVIELRAGRFHGFAVRHGDMVHGYVDRCPHLGLPMTPKLDDYLTERGDLIRCHWHGALFRIEDGACVGGPCPGTQLTRWPLEVRDGMIITA